MDTPLRALLPIVVIAAASFDGVAASAAEPLVVRIFDTAAVPRAEMDAALATAAGVLRPAGLAFEWRDCTGGCGPMGGGRDLLLRILTAPPGAAPGALGNSVVDLQMGSGTLATVYADRIAAAAWRTRVAIGTLLGRAIAHEIGHLLLGTAQHSATGLMRALWSDLELQRNAADDWVLTPDIVARLAQREGRPASR
jgi:hypothetical protein